MSHFQVRELYSNIRWHDIENNHPLYVLDKESRKSVRLFKKAIVRRKCTDGQSVKYLLDFGKRRAIPDVVIKHGSLLEQPSSEKKKYWLNESYVPLHLVKNFEERRIVRKSNDKTLGKFLEIGRVKRVPEQRGFSYLFSRMEKSNFHQCGHCKKDVPIRYLHYSLIWINVVEDHNINLVFHICFLEWTNLIFLVTDCIPFSCNRIFFSQISIHI